jgi:alpha-L-fucosidase
MKPLTARHSRASHPAAKPKTIVRNDFRAKQGQVKSAATLVDLYYSSAGRGDSFLLNLAPDRRGQVPNPDVRSLCEFRRLLDSTFAIDYAQGTRVSASNT